MSELRVCVDELGPQKAVAVTAVSESYPSHELAQAKRLARDMNCRLMLVDTNELADEHYASNPTNRCFYCKQELFTTIFPVAQREGLATVVYGAFFIVLVNALVDVFYAWLDPRVRIA